jgi:hypothetical protein
MTELDPVEVIDIDDRPLDERLEEAWASSASTRGSTRTIVDLTLP